MTDKRKLYCGDFIGLGCCGSCHSDFEDGWDQEFEDEYPDFIFMRCCSARGPTKDKISEFENQKGRVE